MKTTVADFQKMKDSGRRLTMLTAYDYATARLVDACGIDGILVGDSLGMVCLGYATTLQVTMEDMIHHTRAAARGTDQALLVGDMPFLSYQVSVSEAIRNAGRLVQEGGAEAVKLEGGTHVLPQIRGLVRAQIPVMGHLGMTPQSVHVFGGFKVQGQDPAAAGRLLDDARRLEEAGVFAIVLECIPEELASEITRSLSVPTIGIGAGPGCDGQILVLHDLVNLCGDRKPRFVKVFADAGATVREGVRAYAEAVRAGDFPGPEQAYHRKGER